MSAPRPDPGFALSSLGTLAGTQRIVLVGSVFALVAAGLYGINIPAARVASQAGLPGADLVAWRAFILLSIIAAYAWLAGERLALLAADRATVLRLAVAASLTATLYLSSLDHLPVPMAVVIFYSFPLIVMLLSNRLEGRQISLTQIGLFGTAFVGLMLAVGPSLAGLSIVGMVYAFLGALACAAMFILAGRVEDSPMRMTFWTQAVMAPVALIFSVMNGGPASLAVFAAAPLAIFIAMAAYGVAFVLQLMASARISPGRASLLFLFEPVTAIVVAWILLGETLSLVQCVGLVLILLALVAEVQLGARGLKMPAPEDSPAA